MQPTVGESVSSSSASSAHPAAEQETALVAAVLEGDRKATADFVALYSDSIYRYLRTRLFPREDLAEDLLQDVFLAAWSRLSQFRGDAPLKHWLLGIARHKVEEHYRGRLRDSELYDDEEEPGLAQEPDLDELLDRERLEQKMRAVLAALPEAYRTVLLWRYWEARSTREIAEMTDKTKKRSSACWPAHACTSSCGGTMSDMQRNDVAFARLAAAIEPIEPADRGASSRLKSRIYSALMRQAAAAGPLRSLAETKAEGRGLCLWEELMQISPLPEGYKRLNHCRLCHARVLGESMKNAPLPWKHCPYADFQKG